LLFRRGLPLQRWQPWLVSAVAYCGCPSSYCNNASSDRRDICRGHRALGNPRSNHRGTDRAAVGRPNPGPDPERNIHLRTFPGRNTHDVQHAREPLICRFGFKTGKIGEDLLVRSSSPNPSSRTSSHCRTVHFSCGETNSPASVRVSWRGSGGTVFTKKVPPILPS
jgi:hypothetical protein